MGGTDEQSDARQPPSARRGGDDASAPPAHVALPGESDTRELTRRIALSFSSAELNRFAHGLGIFTTRGAPSMEGARLLVRAHESGDALRTLLLALREHKPLVEWPEPAPRPDDSRFAPSGREAGPDPRPGPPEPPSADDSRFAPRSAPAAPPGDPEPVLDGPGDTPSAPAPSPSPPLDDGEMLLDPFAPLEPPVVEGQEPESPRLMVAALAVAFVVGGGLGAALMYQLGPRRPEPAPVAAPQRLALSELAAAPLLSAARELAGVCGAPEELEGPTRDALVRALERCPEAALPFVAPHRAAAAAPASAPSTSVSLPVRRPSVTAGAPRPVRRGPDPCLEACESAHTGCKESRCGAEPNGTQAHATWTHCLTGCLSEASHCRLGCR